MSDDDMIKRVIEAGPKSLNEALAIMSGADLESARAAERARIARAELAADAQKYRGTAPDAWPKLHFNWDVSVQSQRFALDGYCVERFATDYPAGFLLGWVLIAELERVLIYAS